MDQLMVGGHNRSNEELTDRINNEKCSSKMDYKDIFFFVQKSLSGWHIAWFQGNAGRIYHHGFTIVITDVQNQLNI